MYNIQHLVKTYSMGKVQVKALDDVSFTIPDGDIMVITGKSGSGKSTLLRQMGLLDRPTSGSIIFGDQEVTRLSEGSRAKLRLRSLGYIFQEYALLEELNTHKNVYLPGMMLGESGVDYRERARQLLYTVGLGERINHYPKELSGGEQQRVAIARALINNPRVLLADEPCANLDTESSTIVMKTLVRMNKELGVTVIFVSHDPDDKVYAQNAILLSDGKLVENSRVV